MVQPRKDLGVITQACSTVESIKIFLSLAAQVKCLMSQVQHHHHQHRQAKDANNFCGVSQSARNGGDDKQASQEEPQNSFKQMEQRECNKFERRQDDERANISKIL